MDESQEQAIEEVLVKFDLQGDRSVFTVLLKVAAKERDFERFYRHASKLVGDEKMRRTLETFANTEAMHQQEIQEIYEEAKGTRKMPDKIEDLLKSCPWQSPVVTAGMPPTDLIDMVINLEKEAQIYYEARTADTTDPEILELLEYLSVVEEEQYVRLKVIRSEIR